MRIERFDAQSPALLAVIMCIFKINNPLRVPAAVSLNMLQNPCKTLFQHFWIQDTVKTRQYIAAHLLCMRLYPAKIILIQRQKSIDGIPGQDQPVGSGDRLNLLSQTDPASLLKLYDHMGFRKIPAGSIAGASK